MSIIIILDSEVEGGRRYLGASPHGLWRIRAPLIVRRSKSFFNAGKMGIVEEMMREMKFAPSYQKRASAFPFLGLKSSAALIYCREIAEDSN